jgi:hypothetical protein
MSETPQHTPAATAAAYRYSAVDLAHFAGVDELAAGAAVAGAEGRRLRARLLADEMAAGHCVMMRLAARTDYAMTNAAGLGGRHALAFDLVAARFAGTAGRLMDQYRRGLLSLGRLDGADGGEDGEWVGVGFEHQPSAAPEEQAAIAAADAVARRLTAEAGADNLGIAGAPDRARLFLDELSAGHRMMMRLAGRTDWQIDRAGAPAVDEEPTQRAILRLSSAMARLMERVRLGFLALERSPSDPGGGPRKVAGYYWTDQTDMLADQFIGTPANDGADDAAAPAAQSLAAAPVGAAPCGRPRSPQTGRSHAGAPALARRGRLKNGNPSGDYRTAPRCGARTRAGCSCHQPAMRNGRCRFHGGKSTGPRTAAGLERCRSARLAHGFRSAEVIDLRKAAAATGRRLRALLAAAPPAGHGVHPPKFDSRLSPRRKPGPIFQRPVVMGPGFRRGDTGAGGASGESLHPLRVDVVDGNSVVNLLPLDVARSSPSVIPFSAGHGLHRHDSQGRAPATGARTSRCNIRFHLRSSAAANF